MLKAGVLALAMAGSAYAQFAPRWRLEFEMEAKPRLYTQRSPTDKLTNYWYFTFTLANKTEERVPLIFDAMLYVETTKTLMHDVDKVDIIKTESVYDRPLTYTRPYEKLLFGRFYTSTIYPEAEYDIIIDHVKLGNRPKDKELNDAVKAIIKGNRGIQEESILEFKKAYRFLNFREIRQKGWIQPGEQIHGIAIFGGVDSRANVIELHVSGLCDILRLSKATDEEVLWDYENRILRIIYEFPGDSFGREKDVLMPPPKREWVVKHVGPIASRETIDSLVQVMVDFLKFETEWRVMGRNAEEIAAERKKLGILDVDVHVSARTFQQAVNRRTFGYDPAKSAYENRKAIWKMHEFWLANKGKLAYDPVKNYYVVREDTFPGKINIQKDN